MFIGIGAYLLAPVIVTNVSKFHHEINFFNVSCDSKGYRNVVNGISIKIIVFTIGRIG